MPYTLVKFLLWAIAFFGIGVLVGWMLRALKARGEVATARRAASAVPAAEAADTSPADDVTGADERDDVEPTPTGDDERDDVEPTPTEDDERDDVEPTPTEDDERDDVEPTPTEATERHRELEDPEPSAETAPTDADARPELDLEQARAVLGAPIRLDDLTVVDGIGPKIAELCAGVGITTWSGLAEADEATLRSMLEDAGSRFRVHDPSTWSRQAGLLADGRWSDFVAFNDELNGDA